MNKHFILEYQEIAQRALIYNDLITLGLCLNNISREYQRLGAYRIALDTVNKSLEYLVRDFGSTHYFEALLNRVHYYIALGLFEGARSDLEILRTAPIEKIQSDILALELLFQNEICEVKLNRSSCSWIDRLENKANQSQFIPLTSVEQKFIEFIAKGKFRKNELFDFFSNDESDIFSKDNRIRNLISRIRKKRPSLIIFDGMFYFLNESFQEVKFAIATKTKDFKI